MPTIGIGRFRWTPSRRLPRWRPRSWATGTSRPPIRATQNFYSGLTFFLLRAAAPGRTLVRRGDRRSCHAVGKGYAVQRITPLCPPPTRPPTAAGAPVPADLRKPGFSWTGNGTDIVSAVNAGTALLYHPRPRQLVRLRRPWLWRQPGQQHLGDGQPLPGRLQHQLRERYLRQRDRGPAGQQGRQRLRPQPSATYWAENFVRKVDGARRDRRLAQQQHPRQRPPGHRPL